jgi:hypothetical protein
MRPTEDSEREEGSHARRARDADDFHDEIAGHEVGRMRLVRDDRND